MGKSRAFDYMQVPLAIVATELTGASIEEEGAYFRLSRLLGINGPMRLDDIRRKIGEVTFVEHALDHRSTDAEQLLSFSWVEEWREKANAARTRLSGAGKVSAEKRAKKKRKLNTRSTDVEHTLNSSSTCVEHATILSSTIREGSEKEHARKVLFSNSRYVDPELARAELPDLVAEGVNFPALRDSIRNWSDAKDEKRTDRGWLATYRTFHQRDKERPASRLVQPTDNATRRDLKTTW